MQTSFRICEAMDSRTPMTKPGYVTHLNEAANRDWPASGKHFDTKGSCINEKEKPVRTQQQKGEMDQFNAKPSKMSTAFHLG